MLFAGITAVATGLGAIPFLLVRSIKKKYVGYANALAAGLMLAASFMLVDEGLSFHLWKTAAGFVAGLILIHLVNLKLADNHGVQIGELRGADALKALMIVGVMTLHSFAEGIGVGVAFGDGNRFGVFISVAIAVHNIPEGIAISIVLLPMGIRWWKVFLWAVFSSIPQPLLAVPAFLFVDSFKQYLPVGLGLAGGAMIWMVASEILPDALGHAKKENVALIVAMAAILMVIFQFITNG